jgi:hypothetical protein
MADWAPIAAEPEQHLATSFARAVGLTVPVDVESVVTRYADIEFDNIPGDVDAVLIRRASSRPRLIAASRLSAPSRVNRYRFTLAHELGHIIIPWQVATIYCHVNIAYHAGTILHQRMEAEANRFAAELLVPHSWATLWVRESGGSLAERTLSMSRAARVSPEVAVIASGNAAPADCMLLLLDEHGHVVIARDSPQSNFLKVPGHGESIDYDALSSWGRVSIANAAGKTIVAVDCTLTAVAAPRPTETSAELLQEVLNDVEPNPEDRQRLRNKVAGCIGYANDKAGTSASVEDILIKLRLRLIGREDIGAVADHPKLQSFLLAKAHELANRRKTRL